MHKRRLLMIAASVFMLSACTPTPSPARVLDLNGKTIQVGGELYAPMFLQNDNGGFTGFDVDILSAICKEINCQLRYQIFSYDTIFEALTSGKIEVAASGYSITEERELIMDFTEPYLILRPGTPDEDRLGYPVQNGSELRQALNTGLDLIRKNGAYDQAYATWFPGQ